MNQTPLFQVLVDLRHYIEYALRTGFIPEDELVESAVEAFNAEAPAATLCPYALKLAGELTETFRDVQGGWPEITDCDRVDAAFEIMERSGLICRQHYTCCGTCGAFEMHDEMNACLAEGVPVRGYVFYHEQDTESAVDGYGLYLSYGSTEPGEAAALAVGAEIVEALERAGLRTRWNGRWSTRIWVDVDWKRRPPSHAPRRAARREFLH